MTDTRPTPNGEPMNPFRHRQSLWDRWTGGERLAYGLGLTDGRDEARATATPLADKVRALPGHKRGTGGGVPPFVDREWVNRAAVLDLIRESEARATATPGLREALRRLYTAVGAIEGIVTNRDELDAAFTQARAALSASPEPEARATATPGLPSVTALANALHDVDDDVQFIRRDARNLPVLAGRLRAALSASGETDPRATATPGLDVERLARAMWNVRIAHPRGFVTHDERAEAVAAEYAALHPDKDSSR